MEFRNYSLAQHTFSQYVPFIYQGYFLYLNRQSHSIILEMAELCASKILFSLNMCCLSFGTLTYSCAPLTVVLRLLYKKHISELSFLFINKKWFQNITYFHNLKNLNHEKWFFQSFFIFKFLLTLTLLATHLKGTI